jgi:hypothetical protein
MSLSVAQTQSTQCLQQEETAIHNDNKREKLLLILKLYVILIEIMYYMLEKPLEEESRILKKVKVKVKLTLHFFLKLRTTP